MYFCIKIHTDVEDKEHVIDRVGKAINMYYNISNIFTKKKTKNVEVNMLFMWKRIISIVSMLSNIIVIKIKCL